MSETAPFSVGVIGVGSMGRHHARVYHELPIAELVGIHDVDTDRAREVATDNNSRALPLPDLLAEADAVSVAVPTEYHEDLVRTCIDAGVDVLVEKPITGDPETGRELVDMAEEAGVRLHVGHVERFNPAVTALTEMIGELSPVALSARRLGPPPGRDIADGPVTDLMIHDIDVLLSLFDEPSEVTAAYANGHPHVSAQLRYDDGFLATLTASRASQKRVRELELTAEECTVSLDYTDQSIRIHRRTVPEYVQQNGDVRFRNRSVVELPTIDSVEPLKEELSTFIEACATGEDHPVSGEDGLRALKMARRIQRAAAADDASRPEVSR
ncbi:Gfo/Idh/MocA family protein [Candidatus Halobonum tyrrellensis]|uniref:Putative dehydrogenase n=1 Tax=Candidatus Halobonum tyrrellensis G22 TaxID=1324957 RepID=V4IUP2_9EURY|nr:Gfo/Idh/MocA family oxidoreductase [Candidatus Halobonum tyrrellensis]ESP86912.1 putative dehydrogenase [Candidatus Halobonum tyrrellensis G22]